MTNSISYIQEYSDIKVSRNLMGGPLFNKF